MPFTQSHSHRITTMHASARSGMMKVESYSRPPGDRERYAAESVALGGITVH